MGLAGNALCAKAQAMYGARVLPEEYADLCRKQSVSDIVNFLKQQPNYKEVFADVNSHVVHRQQVEELLDKNYFMQCSKLIRYAPKAQQPFYIHEIMYLEVTILVDKIMYLSNQKKDVFAISVPDYIAKKMSFDVYGLIPITSFDGLKQHVKGTKYEDIIVGFDFTGRIDFNTLEKQLIQLYIDRYISIIKDRFKGDIQKQLIDILSTSLELQNITRMYRLKKYFNASIEDLDKISFLTYKRMPSRLLEELKNAKDMKTFMKLLSNSRYRMKVTDDEFIYMEHDVEEVEGKLAKKHLHFSDKAPLVYLAYCTLQKIEVNNLKHIIEGIRYQKDASSIEEMLIYV
ncbi:MAG: V0D/AC39 family V-type ATPase subunit [Coprobacillaceae bacterium]